MRPPVDTIVAPPFPKDLTWLNVAPLRMEQQATPAGADRVLGLLPPELAADAALPEGLARALRGGAGCASSPSTPRAFRRAATRHAVRDAVERLGIEHPVAIDPDFELWRAYDNPGWPARYLFAPRLRLADFHHGEGDYHGCERAIRELLEIGGDADLVPLVRAADDDDAPIVVPTRRSRGRLQRAVRGGRGMGRQRGRRRR